MESHIVPHASSVWEGAQKRNNCLCQHFCLADSCPPPTTSSCPDARQFSSSCVSLVPFELLPECWSSEGVWVGLCGPFKRSASVTSSALSHSATVPTGTSLPGTGTLGLGALCGDATRYSSGRTSATKISLLTFKCHMCGTSLFCVSAPLPVPLLLVSMWFFCVFLVTGFLFS